MEGRHMLFIVQQLDAECSRCGPYMYSRGLTYRLQAMNWWKIIIHTLAFLTAVTGSTSSTPYTLSAESCMTSYQVSLQNQQIDGWKLKLN